LVYSRKSLRKSGLGEDELGAPSIQALINIRLDKDTPKEYWDRVLALLGERGSSLEARVEASDANTESATDEKDAENHQENDSVVERGTSE